MQITDTAAIVTGGASGLGAATAAALAAGGAQQGAQALAAQQLFGGEGFANHGPIVIPDACWSE